MNERVDGNGQVGIVVVSHSRPLAEAVIELALQMGGDRPPKIVAAAGTADGGIGTDAGLVAQAIEAVSSSAGVLVLMDLGSAILSAELALELAAGADGPIVLTSAPLVEGAVMAVVAAGSGASLEDVDREARSGLVSKLEHLDDGHSSSRLAPATPPAAGAGRRLDIALVNPAGLHARPAARLVAVASAAQGPVSVSNLTAGRGPADARSLSSVAALGARGGDLIRIEASGAEADRIIAEITAMIEDGFGELDDEPDAGHDEPGDRAIGISPGRGAGPVARLHRVIVNEPVNTTTLPPSQRRDAVERLRVAADETARALRDQATGVATTSADILTSAATLATDPAILDDATSLVLEHGRSPQRAVWVAFGRVADSFRSGGDRLAAREVDVRDVRDHVLRRLDGDLASSSLPSFADPVVLVAGEITPSETAAIDPAGCAAIVTELGGPNSHVAILARSLGIPAVAGYRNTASLADGQLILVDGDRGVVDTDPDPAAVRRLQEPPPPQGRPTFDGRGRTADGRHVPLLANAADAAEVGRAVAARAEGIGLLRTEFLFLGHEHAPSVTHQADEYAALLAPLGARPAVVRTLDAGSDKPLRFVMSRNEPNPALGVRGIRIATSQPALLDDQLRALAIAGRQVDADVRVMAPMVTTVDEAAEFRERCRGHGLAVVGVMIETPAAALRAEDIVAVVDFVSIGTNDLTQYAMAADREANELSHLTDSWQPAVLDLIAATCEAGRERDTPVGICGEAAADPTMAAVLVGLGASSLSMAAPYLADVAARLGVLSMDDCRRAADAARRAPSAGVARDAARASLPDEQQS